MIQPTSNFSGPHRPENLGTPAQKQPASAPASETLGDRLSSSNSQALRTALSNTPEIRPEVVERGRLLAADSNYPPRQIIDGIARLMTETADLTEKE
jgi:hypothetical protein